MIPYVFFLDIDETLAVNGAIPEENLIAIRNARRAGHKVYINSGRAPGYLPDFLDRSAFDGFVLGCGNYILSEGELLLREALAPQDCMDLCACLSAPGDPGILYEGERYVFRFRPTTWAIHDNWILGETSEELRQYLDKDCVIKITVTGDLDPVVFPDAARNFDLIRHPWEGYTECCRKGFSKATGMKVVMDRYGLPLTRSVAIGDSENDVDMISSAGIGIAMGQARPEIQNAADRITASASDGGVAKAIEALIQEANV